MTEAMLIQATFFTFSFAKWLRRKFVCVTEPLSVSVTPGFFSTGLGFNTGVHHNEISKYARINI